MSFCVVICELVDDKKLAPSMCFLMSLIRVAYMSMGEGLFTKNLGNFPDEMFPILVL